MALKLLLRKDPLWRIICTCPDVCKTPVGSVPTPVPYPVTSSLSPCKKEVRNVKANGKKVLVADSATKITLGDQAGILKGIKSQTTGGQCVPIQKSSSVTIGRHKAVRAYDVFWMNARGKNGNTVGIVIQISPPSTSLPDKPEKDLVARDKVETTADIISEIVSMMVEADVSSASQIASKSAPFAK